MSSNLVPVDFGQPAPNQALALVVQRLGGILRFPSKRFDVRVEIQSYSEAGVSYTVARNAESRIWSCRCPGWIHSKRKGELVCKHLKLMAPVLEQALELQAATQPQPLPIPDGIWQP